jgi:hypothetical protein
MNETDPDQDDYELGWGRYALEGVEVHEISGDHDDLTSEPNVGVLAEKLNLCLGRDHNRQSSLTDNNHVPVRQVHNTIRSHDRSIAAAQVSLAGES